MSGLNSPNPQNINSSPSNQSERTRQDSNKEPQTKPITVTESELHAAPLSTEEVLKNLVYFRQLDRRQKDAIYSLLEKDIEGLKQFAPNVQAIQKYLAETGRIEDSIRGVNLFNATIKRQAQRRSMANVKPLAKVLYETALRIIKFFEQMHQLFPNMTQDDFYSLIFITDIPHFS